MRPRTGQALAELCRHRECMNWRCMWNGLRQVSGADHGKSEGGLGGVAMVIVQVNTGRCRMTPQCAA